MADTLTQICELLHETSETHRRVFRITDGDDPDWPSWYSDWLIDLSELPALLGVTPVRSELVYMLVKLDKEYVSAAQPASWEDYYARHLQEHFAGK